MAKGITLKTKNGTKAYPKSVTDLIFDNATGKTLKQIIDELKAADSATDTRTQFYKASVTDLDGLNAAANIGTYNYVGNGWRGLVQVCFDHSSNVAQVALSSSSPSYEGNVLSFIAAQPCAMARVYRNGAWSHWEKVGTSVVNDLTTGGTDKALSAEMGKTLKEGLDQLGPKIAKALPRDIAEDGLWICDASGKALLRLDTLDTKGGVGTNLAATIKGLIESAAAEGLTTIEASAIGETLTSLIQALIEEYAPEPTPTPSGGGNIMEVEEDGFYICNGNGQVIASWIDGEWDFGQGGGGGSDEGCPKYVSALAGMDGGKVSKDMAANEELQMTDYPRDEKKGTQLMFGGKITSTFSKVRLGRKTAYDYAYVEVDDTNISIKQGTSDTSYYIATAAHGLTISTMLNINFAFKNDGQVRAYVQTLGGGFEFEPTRYDRVSGGETVSTNVEINFYGSNGIVYAETIGTAMTGCQLSAHNPDFKCPIWMFGDSYFSIGNNRWTGVMKSLGYFNFYLNGLSGRTSSGALADVNRALKFGCPKYLLFSLITNDHGNSSGFISNVDSLISVCEEKGIIPIFATQGGLPNKNYKPHCDYIVSTGKRYIDFAHEVATNGWESGSTWYTGLLYTDNVHPTANGAKALAMRALKDMPELLQCIGGYE